MANLLAPNCIEAFASSCSTLTFILVSAVVKYGGVAALRDTTAQATVKTLTLENRNTTTSALKSLGYDVIPSEANFFMVNLKRPIVPVIPPKPHPIFLAYQWLDTKTKTVVVDGFRSMFQEPLAPRETRVQKIFVEFPEVTRGRTLRLSLVQEGCAWSYQDPGGAVLDIELF